MTTDIDKEIQRKQKIVDEYKDSLKDKAAVELEDSKVQKKIDELKLKEKSLKYGSVDWLENEEDIADLMSEQSPFRRVLLSIYEKELKELKEMKERDKLETLYFTWEERPAVIQPVGDGDFGYCISPGNDDWTLATPQQVADFFIDGSKMSKSDFEIKFGVIGVDLPNLPLEKL